MPQYVVTAVLAPRVGASEVVISGLNDNGAVTHCLSTVAYAQGRYEEAERLTHECEQACRATDVHSEIQWRSIRAKAPAHRGAFDEAEQLGREALTLVETGDFLLAHAEALMDFAEVLELAGRSEDAVPVLEEAVRRHEQKENLLGANRAREQLDRVATSL